MGQTTLTLSESLTRQVVRRKEARGGLRNRARSSTSPCKTKKVTSLGSTRRNSVKRARPPA